MGYTFWPGAFKLFQPGLGTGKSTGGRNEIRNKRACCISIWQSQGRSCRFCALGKLDQRPGRGKLGFLAKTVVNVPPVTTTGRAMPVAKASLGYSTPGHNGLVDHPQGPRQGHALWWHCLSREQILAITYFCPAIALSCPTAIVEGESVDTNRKPCLRRQRPQPIQPTYQRRPRHLAERLAVR